MKFVQEKAWQHWLKDPIPGAQILYGTQVDQFGLGTVRTKMRLKDLALKTGGEPAMLARRRKELKKREEHNGAGTFQTLEDRIAVINELLQRSFQGGKKTNVVRIGDVAAGYLARVKKDPDLAAFFPEFTIVHPDPAYRQPIFVDLFDKKVDVGLVALHLYGPMTLLDGQTRLQAAIHYSRQAGRDEVLEEEVAVCVIPGIPVEKAKQIFVTVNATPVPVRFDELIEKDEFNRAYKLTRFVAREGNLKRNGDSIIGGGRGKVRRKAVYQFVMQTLLGGRGEAKNADYLLEERDFEGDKQSLLDVLKRAENALGATRWGDTTQLLVGGYGLATIGRVYYETTAGKDGQKPTFGEALERIKAMEWNVNDARWLESGLAAPSRKDPSTHVSKLTSFDMIRRAVDIILGSDWAKYKRLRVRHTPASDDSAGWVAIDDKGEAYRSDGKGWTPLG